MTKFFALEIPVWKTMWKTWKNYVQNSVMSVENSVDMWIMPKIYPENSIFSTKSRLSTNFQFRDKGKYFLFAEIKIYY